MPAIEIRDLAKSFPAARPLTQVLRRPFARTRREALRGVSLSVASGDRVGLLGPNGAGKTTLLRILAATLSPDRGWVRVLGLDPARAERRIRERLGFVLGDERSFFHRLSARENLRFFAALYGLWGRRAKERIHEVAALVEIGPELDRPFRELSTGMRQRLALGRAFLADPEVILADEPTRGLDPVSAKNVRALLSRLSSQAGKTVLLSTHNLEEARDFCSRIVVLSSGSIVANGTADEIMPRAMQLLEKKEEALGTGPVVP
ncbi:MAG: ABC transporter ATP-binding protein [Myxococcales bacterium]|nr:ABC transporter ATP-binding protein [Myxococcales bacterium]